MRADVAQGVTVAAFDVAGAVAAAVAGSAVAAMALPLAGYLGVEGWLG